MCAPHLSEHCLGCVDDLGHGRPDGALVTLDIGASSRADPNVACIEHRTQVAQLVAQPGKGGRRERMVEAALARLDTSKAGMEMRPTETVLVGTDQPEEIGPPHRLIEDDLLRGGRAPSMGAITQDAHLDPGPVLIACRIRLAPGPHHHGSALEDEGPLPPSVSVAPR